MKNSLSKKTGGFIVDTGNVTISSPLMQGRKSTKKDISGRGILQQFFTSINRKQNGKHILCV
jgi:hypothetical protein